jgi:hypothetical protein
MPTQRTAPVDVSPELLDAIASFPVVREVTHCGATFRVSPFDIYATCPACGARLKVRSFAAGPELEDIFDAVFAWMAQPGAAELVRRRQQELAAD